MRFPEHQGLLCDHQNHNLILHLASVGLAWNAALALIKVRGSAASGRDAGQVSNWVSTCLNDCCSTGTAGGDQVKSALCCSYQKMRPFIKGEELLTGKVLLCAARRQGDVHLSNFAGLPLDDNVLLGVRVLWDAVLAIVNAGSGASS